MEKYENTGSGIPNENDTEPFKTETGSGPGEIDESAAADVQETVYAKPELGNSECSDGNVPDGAMDSEIHSQAEASETGEKHKFSWKESKRLLTADLLLVIAILIVIMCILHNFSGGNEDEEIGMPETVETETNEAATAKVSGKDIKTVLVTGIDDPNETEELETELETEPETELVTENMDWQEAIFGDSKGSVIHSVEISGLTQAQKKKTGYRESDFLSTLSAFLLDNDLEEVTEITFIDEISCSSENAYAFIATMDSENDDVLTAVMYPDYPGCYILMLQDAREIAGTIETETETETESETEESVQTETAAQTEQAQTQAATEAPMTISGTQGSYDANNLTITEIPSTLANYLSNKYEFQYTLYDYLYQNGQSGVTTATVTSYEIDSDTRVATIKIKLSSGGSVTGTYDWNSNSYSYR